MILLITHILENNIITYDNNLFAKYVIFESEEIVFENVMYLIKICYIRLQCQYSIIL